LVIKKSAQKFAQDRPYVFVVGLFILQLLSALPFVAAAKLLGVGIEPLRLIIPITQSALMIWVIWILGWFSRAGFTTDVKDLHVYWYPVLLAFIPVLVYGSIRVPAGPLTFYAGALIFTGISEEAFARGIILPALMPRGKWVALFFAATLFSIGHFTNLFFEDFGVLEIAEKLLTTFAFAILYGAIFIRTRNIWPLIVLHAIHDYAFLTSGTAGPFIVEPIAIQLSTGLAILSIAYGLFVANGAVWKSEDQGHGSPEGI